MPTVGRGAYEDEPAATSESTVTDDREPEGAKPSEPRKRAYTVPEVVNA